MPSKTTKMRMAAAAALTMARHPKLRRVTVRAAKPPAKVGWRAGKVVAKRKARAQTQRVGATAQRFGAGAQRVGASARDAGALALIYGPMVAEVFGLVERPKPSRRVPAFVAGVATGAGALYVVNRNNHS